MSKFFMDPRSPQIPSEPSSIPIVLILQIVALIIKLILAGTNESDAIEIASAKHHIPVYTVKNIWKNHK